MANKVKTFIETFTPKVKKIAKSKGITDPNIIRLIVQQAGYESNYGTSRLALDNNNYWGITNGGLKNGFKKFKSTEDGISYLIDLLNNNNYRNTFNNKDFINSLSGNPTSDSKAFSNWINYKDNTHNAYEHEGKYQRDFHLMKTFFNEYNNYNTNQNVKENNKPPLKNVKEFEYPTRFTSDLNTNKFETGGLAAVDIPSIVIQSKGRKLPNPNTSKGRKQSKFYTARILNGDMDISTVPEKYRASVSNYLKSQSIEQAARDRKGYEGLNELMYVSTGGFPALLGDVASKSAGWITDKAFNIAGVSEDSKARKYTKLATQIAAGLYTGGKTAWNDIGVSKKIFSATHRPKVRYKYSDIYDVFDGDILHAQQIINDGLLGDKTQLAKKLHKIKGVLAQANYNSKTNYKLNSGELIFSKHLLENNPESLMDTMDYYIREFKKRNNRRDYNEKALNYITTLEKRLKENPNSFINGLFKDKPNIVNILTKSPEYNSDAITLATKGYSEEDIIKQLIQQKHTFVRGVNVQTVDKPIENYFLELIDNTSGGRSDQRRKLGTIYTSNSINTAAGYSYRNADGTSMVGIIRRKPETFNFKGDISKWWDDNPIYKSAIDVKLDTDISMDIARSTSSISKRYISRLNDLPESDIRNLENIWRSKYSDLKVQKKIDMIGGYPEPQYNHFVFEGPSGTKLNEYELYKVYIDEEIDNLIKGMKNIHRGHNNDVTPGFSLGNRFGGMVKARRKFADGGIYAPGYTSYGSTVNASDVDSSLTSADGEGIIGGSIGQGAQTGMMSGLGLGLTATAAGLKIGSLAGSWLGPIGMAAGALIGGIIGVFGGRNKKKREERRRAEAIAQQQETNRQAIIGNMESKEESDVAQLRQIASNTPSEGTSFYTKFGGMIPHRKLFKNGGQIIQNSSNTAMAYGPSHENGGIAYGENAEIEGGEAIRQTPIGDQIYSDKLFIPGTRRTFADGAQVLSEIKGMKEQEVQSRGSRILGKLEQLDRTRVNKLKMGTLIRNIEKDALYMDKSAGQVVVLDKKLNDLFNTQEAVALVKGLRGNPQIARMGGCIRKKYVTGGYDMSDVLTKIPVAYNTSGVTTTPNFDVNAFNNLNLTGLGLNVLGTSLGMISNALSARTARKSLDWQMRNLTPAKRAKLIAPRYSTDYNINSDLQDLATKEQRVAQYIKSNTSNPILARNLITKTAIDSLALRNRLYSQKRDYQTQRWDANINARIQTDNQNRQNDYLDQIDLRNHNIQYLGAIGNVKMQRDANFNAYLGDLATAGHQYLTAKAYSTLWPTGVQRTMNTGLRCGGFIKGRRK